MEIKAIHTDIVILAEAHNPSIISPDWVKSNLSISEKINNFIHTPPFSMVESDSFVLVVEQNRWQISAKKHNDEKILELLLGIAKKYATTLSHIPYKGLGFNFIWQAEPSGKEKSLQVNLKLDSIGLESIITGHELNYGGIIYAKKAPYFLRLVMERKDKEILVYNFNYHHEITGMTADNIGNLLQDFKTRYIDSQRIIQKLYSM